MKRFLTVCIFLLGLVMFSCSVCNAECDYIRNFSKKYTYNQNQFEDVTSEWFSYAVQQAYETGLMYGNSKTTFNPNGNIDNAAVITIASRLHSIYNYDTDKFDTNASNWYEPYLNYAVSKGICDGGIDMNAIATRGFFAGVIGNAIDNSIFPQKNVIENGELSDVTGWYSNAVYTFYRAGVLSGNDEYGTFAPDAPITRAEVAAILSRIVIPSERVNVALKSRPKGTYSIIQDDGSLEAFKQRALVANFKVLIGGEEKNNNWENDKHYIYHSGTAGIASETIIIPKKYIDSRYSDIYNDNVIVFKNSWVNPNLSGETTIPIYYFEYNLPFQIGGRTYTLSVVNTGGEVDFYGGIIINGDLQLYYPGKSEIEGWIETITYNDYTAEAQRIIDSVVFPKPTINQDKVKAYVNSIYPNYEIEILSEIYVGYLTDWENSWIITMNRDNIYQPSPRAGQLDRLTQDEYIFYPTEERTIQWCQKNFEKYVIALKTHEFNTPVMLAEISGYIDSKEEAEIKAWDYTNSVLNIEWKQPEISFENPIILINNNGSAVSVTNGLTHAVENSKNVYSIEATGQNTYEFFMFIENDEITIVSDEIYSRDVVPLSRFVKLTLNSTAATVGELRPLYNAYGGLTDYDYIITQNKVSAPIKPQKIDGEIYLPAEFIIEALFEHGYNTYTVH